MASSIKAEDHDDVKRGGLLNIAKRTALRPIQPFVSRPARRAYITTILAISTSVFLLGLATFAYAIFYWSYVPRISFERTIHLQFDDVFDYAEVGHGSLRTANPYPYGAVNIARDLIGMQPYDLVIELTLPRTPANQDAGNFMLDVSMYAPDTSKPSSNALDSIPPERPSATDSPVVARSRRPAIMPYRSDLTDLVSRLFVLPFYLLNLRSESTVLRIAMFERVSFPRSRIPSTLRLEIQTPRRLQIYSARALFRARLRGLRWIMYNHRILSALFGIAAFWTTEMVAAGVAWAVLGAYWARPHPQRDEHATGSRVKAEDEGEATAMSETERVFPSASASAHPLRYVRPSSSSGTAATGIKVEAEDVKDEPWNISEALAKATEADDEDEEDDDEDADFFDSGLGTSLESGSAAPGRTGSMRRRKAKIERGDDEG